MEQGGDGGEVSRRAVINDELIIYEQQFNPSTLQDLSYKCKVIT